MFWSSASPGYAPAELVVLARWFWPFARASWSEFVATEDLTKVHSEHPQAQRARGDSLDDLCRVAEPGGQTFQLPLTQLLVCVASAETR